MDKWEKKRQIILRRDNFTCQVCEQFNPELGLIEIATETNNGTELHEYINHPDPSQTVYRISHSCTGYTFEINFGNCWPVFPIMQVHHKRYIKGKEQWEYQNDDLVTLCKKCHTTLHLNQSIPIYSEKNIFLKEEKFNPSDIGSGRKHNCDDWTFIKKIGGGEYVVTNINPTIKFVLFEHENTEFAKREAQQAFENFINRYFPRYEK